MKGERKGMGGREGEWRKKEGGSEGGREREGTHCCTTGCGSTGYGLVAINAWARIWNPLHNFFNFHPLTSEFLETTFLTTAGKRSAQSFPLATIWTHRTSE